MHFQHLHDFTECHLTQMTPHCSLHVSPFPGPETLFCIVLPAAQCTAILVASIFLLLELLGAILLTIYFFV